MVLMDPPEEAPPKPTPPPMPMQGKVLKQGRCLVCSGRYVLLVPEGEKKSRLMHTEPWCKKFENDPQGFMKLHNAFTSKKRPKDKREKNKRKKDRKKGRR